MSAGDGEHGPAWWARALELERADRLEEAERTIEAALQPNYPYPEQIAELYRLRTLRLLDEGRTSDAAEAKRRAVRWIDFNASCATSGGEGEALMHTAEQFKRTLPEIDA